MDELNSISAKALVDGMLTRKFSAMEVMQAYLNRIDEVNPILNAIIQKLDPDEAFKQAQKADESLAKGKPLGKLHGLPITAKDAFKVKGFVCCKGCEGFHKKKAKTDATVVERLRAEGAIVIGLTNVPELLLAFETDNVFYGQTRNPYDLSRTPGGSSGGESAIIAAGGSPLGIASDAGGSIRQPAHCTGIAGLKPTNGLVPLTGVIPEDGFGLITSVVTYGPMARYVEDLVLTLPILAGPDQRDPYAIPVPLFDPADTDLKKLRIAYYLDNGISTPTEETQQAIKNVATMLEAYVDHVEENRPHILEKTYPFLVETLFLWGDGGKGLARLVTSLKLHQRSQLLKEFVDLAKGFRLSITELRLRLVELDRFRIQMLQFMKDYDVIICPVAATPAKPHGMSIKELKDFTYTMTYNFTGWPVVTVRCGATSTGLPIGVQIIAKAWRDDVALAVAKKVEEAFGGWKPAPNFES